MSTYTVRANAAENADEAWGATSRRGRATCSLWWHGPQFRGAPTGCIGAFQADDRDAALRLLARACARLRERGCRYALGPIDGSTWRRYRLITERGDHPPFFLEPNNPDSWPAYFRAAGFTPAARYISTRETQLARRDARTTAAVAQIADDGVRIRAFAMERSDEELRGLYACSRAAFAQSPFASSIEFPAFAALYRPLTGLLDPAYVALAEARGEIVGFLFAVPDYRGAPCAPDGTARANYGGVVYKTIAALPDPRLRGLGAVLFEQVRRNAHERGLGYGIAALVHESNVSRSLAERYGTIIRRYALFGKELP